MRNIIVAVSRFNKIMKDVMIYGTSARMFSNKKNLKFVREFMIPES